MKAHWFADHQDLPKWGIVASLAKTHGIKKICQVAYLRIDPPPSLHLEGKIMPMRAVATLPAPT
ncbi:hypothetical protein BH23VER1_BH23VER1_13510 [soil metagenome]